MHIDHNAQWRIGKLGISLGLCNWITQNCYYTQDLL